MDTNQDWYEVLGLAPDCPQGTIRVRYLSLIQQLTTGPWKGGERPSMRTLHEAFRTLGDPVMRAGYDRSRARDQEEAAPAAAPEPAPAVRACPFCEKPLRPEQATGPEDECGHCGAPLFPAQKHAAIQDSRRLFDRVPFSMRLHFVRASAPSHPVRGVSIDLSLGGLRLMAPVPLTVGERVVLECEFCAAVAVVRRVQSAPAEHGNAWESGLQFVTLALKRQRGGLISASA